MDYGNAKITVSESSNCYSWTLCGRRGKKTWCVLMLFLFFMSVLVTAPCSQCAPTALQDSTARRTPQTTRPPPACLATTAPWGPPTPTSTHVQKGRTIQRTAAMIWPTVWVVPLESTAKVGGFVSCCALYMDYSVRVWLLPDRYDPQLTPVPLPRLV